MGCVSLWCSDGLFAPELMCIVDRYRPLFSQSFERPPEPDTNDTNPDFAQQLHALHVSLQSDDVLTPRITWDCIGFTQVMTCYHLPDPCEPLLQTFSLHHLAPHFAPFQKLFSKPCHHTKVTPMWWRAPRQKPVVVAFR